MRKFELEEGEAYIVQDDDDDENIDPDRDFSYIVSTSCKSFLLFFFIRF